MPNVPVGYRIPWNATHEIGLGPFAGGMNTYSDESNIADTEMVDCVNFDIDLDGSLKSRPPWRLLWESDTISGPVGAPAPPIISKDLIVGSYVYSSVQMVFFSSSNVPIGGNPETYSLYVYFVNGINDGNVQKIADGRFSKSVRYGNLLYFIPDPGNADDNGWKYYLDGSFAPAQVSLKRGYSCAIYKDRLWITGRKGLSDESRLFFSDPGNVESFPDTNFFDINPGDGDASQDLAVYQDNLCIFKDSATYVLTFDSNPAQAALQVVNTDVGVSGPRCVVAYENSIFILQYNAVYEMVNYDFTRVSVKVPFDYDVTFPTSSAGWEWSDPIWMSRIGDRLIVRFYNRLYVYHIRLRAWSRWDSNDLNIRYLGYIVLIDNTDTGIRLGYNSYVATSSLNANYDTLNDNPHQWTVFHKIFILDDRYESTFVENGNKVLVASDISCYTKTKAFDFGVSARFKRLMHWGVDVITGRDVTGTSRPISLSYQSSWADLENYQWHTLNTWQFPLFSIPTIVVPQPIGLSVQRRYIRFPKSFRFRLVQFEITMLASGNTTDGPAKLYSLTAFMAGKELVPKAVN